MIARARRALLELRVPTDIGKLACVTSPRTLIRDLIARCAGEKPGGAEHTLGVGGEPGCAVAVLPRGAGFTLQIGGEAAGAAELALRALIAASFCF